MVAKAVQSGELVGEDADKAVAALNDFLNTEGQTKASVNSPTSWENAAKAVIGVPEALMSGVTSLAGNAAKLGYMYGSGGQMGEGGPTPESVEARRPTGDKIQAALTVDPGTEQGRLAQEYMSRLIPIGKGIEWARQNWGNSVGDALEGAADLIALPRGGNPATVARAGYEASRATARKNLIADKFPMTAGERGASKVGALASASDSLFAGTTLKRAEAVNEHLTEVALKKADLPAETVLDAGARQRIANTVGPEFDKFKTVTIKDPTGALDSALAQIEIEATLGKDPATLGNVSHLRTLLYKTGEIPGEAWAPMRTRLTPRAAEGDIAAGQIVDVLDDGVRLNAPAAMRPLIDKTRARYRNFKVLSEAAKMDPVGMLTPNTLWQVVQKEGLDGHPLYALGRDANMI